MQWGMKLDSIYLHGNVEEVQPRQREVRSLRGTKIKAAESSDGVSGEIALPGLLWE